jgi:hypothetical protein
LDISTGAIFRLHEKYAFDCKKDTQLTSHMKRALSN